MAIRQLEELISIPFNWDYFSFDTETTSLKYYDVQLDLMSLYDGKTSIVIDFENNEDSGRILHWLKFKFESAKLLIAQNIVFDLKVIHKYGIYPINVELFDTMIADHLIDENREHGLKHMTKTILNREVSTWEESKGNRDKYIKYAADDAINTWDLAVIHKEELKQQGLLHLFRDIEMPFQWVLLDMEINGVKVDLDKIERLTKELFIRRDELEETMLKFLGIKYDRQKDLFGNSNISSPINFSSNQQLGEILFGRFGLKVIETTPGGSPSVGVKTIEVYKSTVPFVELLSKYKAIQKLLTAFFLPLPSYVDGDGRVRPQFRDIGTKTGRLSCNNPNLQQLPKSKKGIDINTRECFVVESGNKMITCDYSGQELRVLTHISKEPTLIESFKEGYDLHLSTANDFFNLNIPKECLREDDLDYEEYKNKFKAERNKAKTVNFGMAYGKAQPLHCKIKTPSGWSTFKDIQVGDLVMQPTGKPTRVIKTTPITLKDIYKITMKDGSSTEAADDHLWTIQTIYDKKYNKYRTISTKEIIPILKKGKWNNCFIDYIKPLSYEYKNQKIHPYLMGLYLGDGDSCNRFTIFKQNIIEKIQNLVPEGYRLSKQGLGSYSIVNENKRDNKGRFCKSNNFIKYMKELGMDKVIRDTKFIPYIYLYGDIEQRKQLLHGLLDSDGSKNNNCYEYVTISRRLADDVIELVKSLGGRATMTSRVPKTNFNSAKLAYRIFISFPPYRKRNSIDKIEYIGKKKCRCITIENKKGLYITDDFIVTHNSSYGFSKDFNISESEAQGILDKYFATLPKVKEAIDNAHKDVKEYGYVKSLTGRRRRFIKENGYYPSGAFRQSFNFLIQGYSADMIRMAAIKTFKLARDNPHWNLKHIMTVHDEIGYEVKEEFVDVASKAIKECFESAIELVIPLKADVSIGNDYEEAK